MPASPSRQPPAPATPTSAVATPRRRRRLLQGKPSHNHHHHSSSWSLQAPASPFTFFPPTSPSPFHRFLPSPLRASSVPFSWEHRPGIPKTPARNRSSRGSNSKALPLPSSLLARSCAGGSDPYASVVPAEYAAAMDPPPPDRTARLAAGWRVRVRRTPRRRSPSRLGDALSEWLSMLSLYRSCKRAAACFAAKAKSPAA